MTGAPPTVSVLMPVRNGLPHLGAAIESLLGQSLTDFELVIVDDGSTDGTLSYLKQAADSRVRVFSLPSVGIAEALNFGLDRCRAPLVARMDADDVAVQHRLAYQVQQLQDRRGVAVLAGAVQPMGACGNDAGPPWTPPQSSAGIRWRLYFTNPIAHPSVMFRRDVVLQSGGYSTEFEAAEDYELWLRLARTTQIEATPEVVLRYRVHAASVTQTREAVARGSVARAAATCMSQDLGQQVDAREAAVLGALVPWQSTAPADFAVRYRASRLIPRLYRYWRMTAEPTPDEARQVRRECLSHVRRLVVADLAESDQHVPTGGTAP